MIDYAKILTELEEERAACQYVYGGMIPAFYTQALHRAIEAVKECQDCAAEAGRMAKEVGNFSRSINRKSTYSQSAMRLESSNFGR